MIRRSPYLSSCGGKEEKNRQDQHATAVAIGKSSWSWTTMMGHWTAESAYPTSIRTSQCCRPGATMLNLTTNRSWLAKVWVDPLSILFRHEFDLLASQIVQRGAFEQRIARMRDLPHVCTNMFTCICLSADSPLNALKRQRSFLIRRKVQALKAISIRWVVSLEHRIGSGARLMQVHVDGWIVLNILLSIFKSDHPANLACFPGYTGWDFYHVQIGTDWDCLCFSYWRSHCSGSRPQWDIPEGLKFWDQCAKSANSDLLPGSTARWGLSNLIEERRKLGKMIVMKGTMPVAKCLKHLHQSRPGIIPTCRKHQASESSLLWLYVSQAFRGVNLLAVISTFVKIATIWKGIWI